MRPLCHRSIQSRFAIDPVPEMESRDTRELTAEYSGLPADFLRMRAVVRDDGKELLYVTSQQMDEMEASGVSVEPQVYTMRTVTSCVPGADGAFAGYSHDQ